MILEEQRYLHEDLERLEAAIAERVSEDPKLPHERLNRDHEVAQLLVQVQKQSESLLAIYKDSDGARARELQQISGGGATSEPFDEFYRQLRDIRDYHAKYPNEQAENSELRYRRRPNANGEEYGPLLVDTMFSGEEAYGRFLDLHSSHEGYLNLPNVKRLTYLQYLELFDSFVPGSQGALKRQDKMTDQYLQYLGELSAYLEGFMRRTQPLEDLDAVFAEYDTAFVALWEKDEVPGWEKEGVKSAAANGGAGPKEMSNPEAVWCADCEKEFKNENVYKGHLSGRKHIKAAEQRNKQASDAAAAATPASVAALAGNLQRLKERAIASREDRVRRLAAAVPAERADARINVERKQGMTERERQQELDNLFSEGALGGGAGSGAGAGGNKASRGAANAADGDDDENDDERVYNPLKLPLAWDGKPIPFWLYRLHGLGVEFTCEICGNFVYMGRRAYEKHFNEGRHIYGLKCLGITSTGLFRDISKIEDALKLWDKIQRNKRRGKIDDGVVIQMEDGEGNVMPEKVYYDLQKQGLL